MSALKAKLLNAKDQHVSKKTEHSEEKNIHSDEQKEKNTKNGHEMRELVQLFKGFFAQQKKMSFQSSRIKEKYYRDQMEPRDREIQIFLPEQTNSQLTLQSLENYISQLCRVVWSRAFHYYSTDQLTLQHTKIYSSQQILKNLVRISQKYKLTPENFEMINNHMEHKVLQYMLNKYPMTLSQQINRGVNNSVREIDNTDQLTNDYIYNSPVNFKFRQTGEYNDLIMKVINQILKKIQYKVGSKSVYQKFQDKMGRLFENIMDLNWMNQSDDSQKELKAGVPAQTIRKRGYSREQIEIHKEFQKIKQQQLEKYRNKVQQYTSYKIGRKLPQSTRSFTQQQISSHNIKIQSSQILRLLTKWCQQLQRKFTTPNYFAHYIETLKLQNGKYVAEVPDEIKQYLDQLMAEQYKNIKNQMVQLANNNYYLQSQILINQLSTKTVTQMQKYQCIASRYSINLVHNLHSYIITYLNRLIHGLLSVALKFGKNRTVKLNQWSSNLNLVTFQVKDLLRCRCASGQKQILKIYHQLLKMSENQTIKIVRVINRLKKGTHDILINIKYREILCEVQLSITSKNNKFIQYSNFFNHYIYELKRSFFGPLIELCSIWKTLDTRFNYYYKIKNSSQIKKTQKIEHFCKSERDYEFFDRPFICSKCSNHYYHSNYIKRHIKCRKCFYWICSKCQIQTMDTKALLSAAFKNQQLIKNCIKISNKNQPIPEFGICVFIQSQQLKVEPFRKHTNKNKTNIIGIKSRHLYEIYDISTPEKQSNFRNTFIIFQISDLYGRKYIKIQDEKLKQFWIEETLRDVFIKNKQRICLNYTNLTNQHLSKFSQFGSLAQKANVKKIQVIGNKLQSINTISKQFKNVKYLEVSKNFIANFDGIQKLQKLQKVFINQNKLKQFPLNLSSLWNMKQLSLSWNEIKNFPDQFAKLHKLNILKIGNNKIEQFSNCLGQLFYLKELSMKYNSIRYIPECIKSLNQLVTLQLQNNQIINIHENISHLVNLQYLNLSNNQIVVLPNSFMTLSNLTNLNLCHNKLKQLPESINSLFSLETLEISNNQLSKIPSINKLHKLTQLNLNYNIISEIQFSQGLSNMKRLSIAHNNLKQIPFIGYLQNLQELYLNNNSISNIHESISKLEKLEVLRLQHNNLAKICQLKLQNLKFLNISQNKLITFCNMQLIYLQELDLSGNFISLFICNILPSMKRINLANNKLQSIDISNYTKLRYIHLSYNQFNTIPKFNDHNHIKVLSLQHNLISNIPDNLNFFHNLSLLNLSHNKLTAVPKEIQNIGGIKERGIDLSQNPIQKVQCWDFLMRKGTKSTIQSLQKTLKVGDLPQFFKCQSKHSLSSDALQMFNIRETV